MSATKPSRWSTITADENQKAGLGRELIGQLPALIAEFAKGYQNVGSVTLVGLAATFDSVKSATGVDLGRPCRGRRLGGVWRRRAG